MRGLPRVNWVGAYCVSGPRYYLPRSLLPRLMVAIWALTPFIPNE